MTKYISTKEAVRLTGLSTQEIYNLIHSGALPARKAPKSGWHIFGMIQTSLNQIGNVLLKWQMSLSQR